MWKAMGLAIGLVLAGAGLAAAEGTEVQFPDGRVAILYDDNTWEFKRPPPEARVDTVKVDALVKNPGKFDGQEVVVTGTVTRMLGAYRLQSNSEQNTIVLDVEQARRADQIVLEQALSAVGFGNSVRVQAQGLVEQSFTTSRLVTSDLIVLGE
jgi:hypothetical protein